MSAVYATEPATTGRVVFQTTHGPIDIALWCRECPTTCRAFIQWCCDGYYHDMIFHRILPQTLIQTGAVRLCPMNNNDNRNNNANSGNPRKLGKQFIVDSDIVALDTTNDSNNSRQQEKQRRQQAWKSYRAVMNADTALERRRYELHSRLRFSHRGQVAMALTVENDDSNANVDTQLQQPQFFITLDEASYLDGKHVLFGTVTGPTMFNVLRIGNQTDVDETTHQPTHFIPNDATGASNQDFASVPRILSVQLVDTVFFPDLQPITTMILPWRFTILDNVTTNEVTKRKKRKGRLDINVLSFGDEMADVVNDHNHADDGTVKPPHGKDDDNTTKVTGNEELTTLLLSSPPTTNPIGNSRNNPQEYHSISSTLRTNRESSSTNPTMALHLQKRPRIRDNDGGDEEDSNQNGAIVPKPAVSLGSASITTAEPEQTLVVVETTPIVEGMTNASHPQTSPTGIGYLDDSLLPPSTESNNAVGNDDVTPRVEGSRNDDEAIVRRTSTSILEARLAKYKRGSRTGNNNSNSRSGRPQNGTNQSDWQQQREEETMQKLLQFQNRVREAVRGGGRSQAVGGRDGAGGVTTVEDNSLATRMARNAIQAEHHTQRVHAMRNAVPVYYGQILQDKDDDMGNHSTAAAITGDGDDNPDPWMATRFQCGKQYLDRSERLGDDLGGDGRAADDYQVIDDKNNRKQHKDHSKRQHSQYGKNRSR